MTTGIRSDASGTFGALTFGGDDAVTFDATGIQAGSYKPGSIVAADFADGALIENAPVGTGYGPGAGGTVTQATSKATPVTLNKPCGRITMHNASLAAGALVNFVCSNSILSPADVIVASIVQSSVTTYSYRLEAWNDGTQIRFLLTNPTGLAVADAVEINFAIIKGATS